MKRYINLFLSLVIPMGILFTAISIVYFLTSYEFSKALKLSLMSGTIISIGVSLFVALIIIIIRHIRLLSLPSRKTPSSHFNPASTPVVLNPTLYEKKAQETQEIVSNTSITNANQTEEQIMLLMAKDLAYEISYSTIIQQEIGDISMEDKEEGLIHSQKENDNINISISSLTKHTSQITISGTNITTIKNLITSLKEKEHSFMQY